MALGGTIANVAVRAIPVDLHAASEFAQIAAYPATQRRGPHLIAFLRDFAGDLPESRAKVSLISQPDVIAALILEAAGRRS